MASRVVDTHVHLWHLDDKKQDDKKNKDVSEKRSIFYGDWLIDPTIDGLDPLRKSFTIDDYSSQINGLEPQLNVTNAVVVEADVPPKFIDIETEHVLNLCKNDKNVVSGIIMKCDPNLKSENFFENLYKYKESSKYIKGIRRVLHILPKQHCLSKNFLSNVQQFGQYNKLETKDRQLTFDIVCQPSQINKNDILKLIAKCPDTLFVMDHCGGHHSISSDNDNKELENDNKQIENGDNDDNSFNAWKSNMKELSNYKNVIIKMSGLVGGQLGSIATDNGPKWTFENQIKTLDYVINTFDNDKIIFGGDWPVCTLAAGDNALKQWINGLNHYLKTKYDKNTLEKVFYKNAVKLYHLDEHDDGGKELQIKGNGKL